MTHEGTAVVTTKVSDEKGEFAFTFLAPGAYTLRIELPGFKTYVNSGFEARGRAECSPVIQSGSRRSSGTGDGHQRSSARQYCRVGSASQLFETADHGTAARQPRFHRAARQ